MCRRAASIVNDILSSRLSLRRMPALDYRGMLLMKTMRYCLPLLLVFPLLSACDPGVVIVRPPAADFTIDPMTPRAYKPGGVVSIKGAGFSESIVLSIKSLKYPLEFVSPNEVLFKIPETPVLALAGESGVGKIPMEMNRRGISKEVNGVYLMAATDYPLITKAASEVCGGEKFYNANGELTEGTKDCSAGSGQPVAACSRDGEVGCVTTSTYKAADLSNLTSANVRNGTTIAGVSGTYPSMITPLASATATTDLTSFGSTTTAGSYEFFDSTGARYSATVASGGTITPTTSSQVFSAAGTMYNSFTVAGDTNLTAVNIKSGVSVFSVGGNVTAAPANCSANGVSGCVTTSTYKSADLTNLTSSNVRNGTVIAGVGGTYPSIATPLASNTGTTDLTSFGPTTTAGSYEFFDSTGTKYAATVGSVGTITPTTSSQVFSAAGTMYNSFDVAGDSNLTAGNIKSGVSIFSVPGGVTPAPADCSANGSQSCVATGSYFAAAACAANDSNCFVPNYVTSSQPLKAISFDAIDAGKASMRDSLILAGVLGTLADCTTNETSGCVTTSTYKSADLSNLFEGNIKSGVAIAGKTGSYPSVGTPLALGTGTPDLASFGSSTPVGTYEFFDSSGNVYAAIIADGATITPTTAAQAFGSTGTMYRAFSVAGDANLTIGNIKSSVSIFGVGGDVTPAPANCSANGTQSCVATGSYFAAAACAANGSNCFVPNYVASSQPFKAISFDAIDAGKASMRVSLMLAGVLGTLADCTTNETSGCVTTSTYTSADLSNLSEGNIKSGVAIAGKTGSYPSAGSPLVGADSIVADLDLATFDAKIKSAATFEWFDSSGNRYATAGDTDITAANIANNVTIFGATGNLVAGGASCTGDGQMGCTTTATFKSVDTSALTTWDIRKGKFAGGITGSIAFYKNMANTALFDRTSSGTGGIGGTGGITGLDIYDTIDEYNNNGAFPTQNNTGWDQATGANWTQVVASTVYKDNITGLVWLLDQGLFTWENAITRCENSTQGSRSDWRLPTQKELMQAYTDGIWSQKTNLSLTTGYYWSASSVSYNTAQVWVVLPYVGNTYANAKSDTTRVVCVAP